MMLSFATPCLRSLLKFFNSIMGMVGIAMIIYGLWLLRVWHRETDYTSSFFEFSSDTWFAYTSVGTGVFLCVITYLGHMAADRMNGYPLSCYMFIIILILLLEGSVVADILLNSDWEKDLPEDPTGKFSDFKDFVESNLDICQWIGLVIISAQGLSILMAMALKAKGPDYVSHYDSDYDYPSSRHPLLKHNAQTPPYAVPDLSLNNNTCWNEGKYMKNAESTFSKV